MANRPTKVAGSTAKFHMRQKARFASTITPCSSSKMTPLRRLSMGAPTLLGAVAIVDKTCIQIEVDQGRSSGSHSAENAQILRRANTFSDRRWGCLWIVNGRLVLVQKNHVKPTTFLDAHDVVKRIAFTHVCT